MCDLTIYHNPQCSKSRQTLELIRSKGVEPEIVLYLEDVPSSGDIADALRMLGMKPIDIIRKNEAEFKEHLSSVDLRKTNLSRMFGRRLFEQLVQFMEVTVLTTALEIRTEFEEERRPMFEVVGPWDHIF